MNLVSFHRGWLGIDPERTPKEFQVSPQQAHLYGAFPKARGFFYPDGPRISEAHDRELLLGTLILALAQIRPNSGHPVFLVIPKVHTEWVTDQMKGVVRYILRTRKGTPGGNDLVADLFNRIYLCTNPFLMAAEPARWTAFGIQKSDILPSWLTEGLIEVPHG